MTTQHNQTAPVSQNATHSCCKHDSIQPIDSAVCQQHQQQKTATTQVPSGMKKPVRTEAENLSSSFTVMGYGMLGIFIFMAIFFLAIKGMMKAFPEK